MKITKAIIPVAGYGTRRLPITKVIEKCLLPVCNRPVIDYVVEDCLKAGIEDIYFVVNSEDSQLKEYYSVNSDLEEYLKQKNKDAMIPLITPPNGIKFHYIVQDLSSGKYGTTVPVWLCRDYVEPDEKVLVIMGDQFLYRDDGGSNSADLIKTVQESGVDSGLLAVAVDKADIPKYGIIDKDDKDNFIRIVEKPKIEDAPSNLNNASFYLFDAGFFKYLDDDMKLPHTGEFMITDCINQYIKNGGTIRVEQAKGEYLDSGNVEGWIKANNVVGSSLSSSS